MTTYITATYASILTLIFIALSVRTLRFRHRYRVAVGTGENKELERAARAHANFAEYVPIALILLFFLETRYGSGIWIHALGASLVIGRAVHAYGISQVRENFTFRVTGMALTFTVIFLAALGNLVPL